jgi:hypothetical protein
MGHFGSPINGPSFIPDGVPSLNPFDPDNSSQSWRQERTYTDEEKKGRIEKPKGYDYKDDKKDDEEESKGGFNIVGFFMSIVTIGIVLMIGISIMGQLQTAMTSSGMNVSEQTADNLSQASQISNFFPLLFIVAIATIILGVIVSAFVPIVKVEQTEEEIKKNIPPHKQTYLEYVQERLRVEKMMK